MTPRQRTLIALALTSVAGALGACGDSTPVISSQTAGPSGAAPPPPVRRAAASASASVAPPPKVDYAESDFTASEHNRDPFRSYADMLAAQNQRKSVVQQRTVAADRFSLDELKLVAIVTGHVAPRAMFVDPQGKGWVVARGEFLGHAETVKQGGAGSTEYDLNWRVDRIRDTDVVFVRDDPSKSNAAGATRVIALRSDAESDANGSSR